MGLFSDVIDFLTFDVLDLNNSKTGPMPTPPTGADRSAAQTEEAKRLARMRSRGGTLLTGGTGVSDDEDLIQKKTLLGA